MFPNITMSLMLLVVVAWVATVQSECITNPMHEINRKAKEQYQTTDEFLNEMEKSTPIKYQNLLRVYGIYRACMERGTQRWTDNVGKDSCPYCRDKIEDEDKNKWCDVDEINQCDSQLSTMIQHIVNEHKAGKITRVDVTKNVCKKWREYASCMKFALIGCSQDYITKEIKALENFNKDPYNCDLVIAL